MLLEASILLELITGELQGAGTTEELQGSAREEPLTCTFVDTSTTTTNKHVLLNDRIEILE